MLDIEYSGLTPMMVNNYGFTKLKNEIHRKYPQATFRIINLNDVIYISITYKYALIQINHYKYAGGTDFDFTVRGILDYSDYDYVNPICFGSINEVINSMSSHVLDYLKRF